MSFETDLDTALTILLGKAQNTITQTNTPPIPTTGGTTGIVVPSSYILWFSFGGGGSALSAATADPYLVEAPDEGEIVWCHVYAGSSTGSPVSCTAVTDIQLGRFDSFGTSTALSGSGTSPRLTAQSSATMGLSGWTGHLSPGDTLVARLTSFTGTATWLAVVIKVRRDSSGI